MIPLSQPLLGGNEKKYLAECVRSGWISSEGPFVKKFEEVFASFIGVKHGIAVSNGTAALETALFALGVRRGDEIIMPSFTIISCAIACLRLGAKPVLVDIEPQTWTMDVSQVRRKINAKTRVIMPVHIYGHPADMDEIMILAKKHGLRILEDIAEAQGAEYYSSAARKKWLKCGAMGDIAAVSFYANKIVTTGEGGMVITNDGKFAEKARLYRNLCFRADERFYHTELGYNFRMSNLQAAVGVAQMERIKEFIAKREEIASRYRRKLSAIDGIKFMTSKDQTKPVYWVYAITLDPGLGINAKEVMLRLSRHGICTRAFFRGLHTQPALNGLGLFRGERYPNTDAAYEYGLYLPSSLTLTKEQIATIAAALKKELRR